MRPSNACIILSVFSTEHRTNTSSSTMRFNVVLLLTKRVRESNESGLSDRMVTFTNSSADFGRPASRW